jgi:hypothetical protein
MSLIQLKKRGSSDSWDCLPKRQTQRKKVRRRLLWVSALHWLGQSQAWRCYCRAQGISWLDRPLYWGVVEFFQSTSC